MLGLKQLSTLVNTVWNAMLQHILCLSVTQQALASAPWPLKPYKHHEKFTNPRWILVLAFPLVCDVLWHPACTYFFSVIHLVMGNAVYTIQWSVNFLTGLIQLNTPFLSGKGIFICNGCDCASRSSSVLPLSKALHHIYIRCKTCMWCLHLRWLVLAHWCNILHVTITESHCFVWHFTVFAVGLPPRIW